MDVKSDNRPQRQRVEQEGRISTAAAPHRRCMARPGDRNQRYPHYRAVQATPRSRLSLMPSSLVRARRRLDDCCVLYINFPCEGQSILSATVTAIHLQWKRSVSAALSVEANRSREVATTRPSACAWSLRPTAPLASIPPPLALVGLLLKDRMRVRSVAQDHVWSSGSPLSSRRPP